MPIRTLILLAVLNMFFVAKVEAQAVEPSVPAPGSESAQTSVEPEVDAALGPLHELDAINAQHDTANALYVTSGILGVLGTGMIFGGLADLNELTRTGGLGGAGVGGYLVFAGVAVNVVHLVILIVAASLDVGSGSHRRNLLRAHPELALDLGPGPGDAGLCVTLRF